MRIPKSWVPVLANEIVNELLKKDMVRLQMTEDQLKAELGELILEELMIEDKINEEVREMLKKYDSEIEHGHLDYPKLFDMTKRKIVIERNLIL